MQAAILPVSAGWSWVQQGYRLFRRQPVPLFFWSLVTSFLITVSYIIPLFGQMALIAGTPVLTFISLSACKNVAAGRTMLLHMWLEPLRDRETRKRLLVLGMAYLLTCLAGGFLATLPFLGNLMASINPDGALDEAAIYSAMRGPLLTFGLMYLLISALFWHAPALIGWHNIRLGQALFFSMVACWRNKWAFLTYGITWAAIFIGVQFLGSALTGIGMPAGVAQMLMTPVNIAVAAVLYCSFYPAYISIFGQPLTESDPQQP